MAYAKIQVVEVNGALSPTGLEVHSDSLDDDATVERVVRNLTVLWRMVVVDDEAET